MREITVLVVEPGHEPRLSTIPNTLAGMQGVVGGNIAAAYVFDDPNLAFVCNEDVSGLPINRCGFVGTFFAVRQNEDGDEVSLGDGDVQTILHWLATSRVYRHRPSSATD